MCTKLLKIISKLSDWQKYYQSLTKETLALRECSPIREKEFTKQLTNISKNTLNVDVNVNARTTEFQNALGLYRQNTV